eukprot:Plantae.Rhodophyta-Purpureofilum_apyrenoidigerum.ctg2818.p1 GENE.Plantae.Rhodophyta-Purpureofilum_apyrenoidigerum.ctg2818~~Plantae.Rhodophyta-Purpureofilum_apyrenoidigerum.ctg2818.p1  ORF type:complete len:236 (-),score=58.93 Plantae.Rhodophyta-Purpureofilum_apyrenoidigerum.ctg2818:1835-2542(-)
MVLVTKDFLRFVSVARFSDQVPVAEYRVANCKEISNAMFEERVDRVMRSGRVRESSRLTILDKEVGSVHYESDSNFVFLVFTRKDYPQRTAFKFLGEIRRKFALEFADDAMHANALELSDDCAPFIRKLCDEFNVLEEVDKVSKVRTEVDEVKAVMQENIQTALERGEQLDVLLDQSEQLRDNATVFKQSATTVKNKFWWQNTTLMIVIGVLILTLVLIIVLSIVLRKQSQQPSV